MKNYKISKYYIGIYVCCLILFLVFLATCIYIYILFPTEWFSYFLLLFDIIAILLVIYKILFDFQNGSFSVDTDGIIMRIGFKKRTHKWEDFRDYDIVGVKVGDGYTYWCYFSTRVLTTEERAAFLRKTRRELDKIAFFQYNAKTLQEILPLMPPEMAEKLLQRAQQIEPNMDWISRIYSK